jgi:hypothetical protein
MLHQIFWPPERVMIYRELVRDALYKAYVDKVFLEIHCLCSRGLLKTIQCLVHLVCMAWDTHYTWGF